jgi:hypothetical protein
MTIKTILLAGAAVCALMAGSAAAEQMPSIHVVALHQGTALAKTKMQHASPLSTTVTAQISTSVSASQNFHQTVPLPRTYYAVYDTQTCLVPPARQKLPMRKTAYGRITASVTQGFVSGSDGTAFCAAPANFYGVSYELKASHAAGKTDHFVSTIIAKYKKYKFYYSEAVSLTIEP